MIELSLRPDQVGTRGSTETYLLLRNTGSLACQEIDVELRTGVGLLLVAGDRRVDLEHLDPGAVARRRLGLRGTREGATSVLVRHLSYRDERGRVHDHSGGTLPVSVVDDRTVPAVSAGTAGDHPFPGGRRSVFVSHRSTDIAWFRTALVERLRTDLRPHRLFVDVHDLHGGQRWPERLAEELNTCAVLLALIGPTWTTGSGVLRWEIRTALERGIPIIQVLCGRTEVPDPTRLPSDIAALAEWQAMRVESRTFSYDVTRLVIATRCAIEVPGIR